MNVRAAGDARLQAIKPALVPSLPRQARWGSPRSGAASRAPQRKSPPRVEADRDVGAERRCRCFGDARAAGNFPETVGIVTCSRRPKRRARPGPARGVLPPLRERSPVPVFPGMEGLCGGWRTDVRPVRMPAHVVQRTAGLLLDQAVEPFSIPQLQAVYPIAD